MDCVLLCVSSVPGYLKSRFLVFFWSTRDKIPKYPILGYFGPLRQRSSMYSFDPECNCRQERTSSACLSILHHARVEVSKHKGFFRVLMITGIIVWGLILGPAIFGNSHVGVSKISSPNRHAVVMSISYQMKICQQVLNALSRLVCFLLHSHR